MILVVNLYILLVNCTMYCCVQLILADTAHLILSSDWSVSLKLCSDWLGELLTDEFQKWRHTNKHTNKQTHIFHKPLLNCSFAVKKSIGNIVEAFYSRQ